MRVALVTSAYPPQVGGVERHVQRLAHHLVRLECEVEVLTQSVEKLRPSVEQEQDGLLVRRWPTSGRSERAPVALGLFKYLHGSRGRYDLIHAHNYHSAAPAMSYLAGCHPLVISSYLHAKPAGIVAQAAHVPYSLLGRRTLRAAAKVVALSKSEAELVAARVPGVQPEVIPSGIDVRWLREAKRVEGETQVVLVVGRLARYKGAARVVEALPLCGEAELVVIGSGPEAPLLEKLAERLRIRAKVRFLGTVDDSELASWYATAGVVVSLSSYESFGLAVLEGLAAGARVIATDIPAHQDIRQYDEFGALCLVPHGASPAEIAAAVRSELLKGRSEPSRMVPSWESVAQWHVDLYERLVSHSRR